MSEEETLSSDARRAADAAVRQTFAILGVDIDDPKSVESFREDLRFGSRLRKAVEHGQMTLVGTMIVAFVSAAWIGISELISRGGPTGP